MWKYLPFPGVVPAPCASCKLMSERSPDFPLKTQVIVAGALLAGLTGWLVGFHPERPAGNPAPPEATRSSPASAAATDSFAGLTAFLRENGLPVSEPTVREFLRKQGAARSTRRKVRKQAANPESSTEPLSGATAVSNPQPELPPSAETHLPYERRGRGPRIADPKKDRKSVV